MALPVLTSSTLKDVEPRPTTAGSKVIVPEYARIPSQFETVSHTEDPFTMGTTSSDPVEGLTAKYGLR